MVGLLFLSGWGFHFIPKRFTPQLNKQYFTIDMWMPEGTKIEQMEAATKDISDFLESFETTRQVSTFIGQTPPRFYLANTSFGPQPNYAQCIVEARSPEEARELQAVLRDTVGRQFPEVFMRVNRFELSTVPQALIEARFCGPDEAILDSLTELALGVMRRNPKVANARNEWGNMAMMVQTDYEPVQAGQLNIGKDNMMEATKEMCTRIDHMENLQGRSFADDILPGYQSEEELEALEEQRQKEQRKSFWSSLFGKKEK